MPVAAIPMAAEAAMVASAEAAAVAAAEAAAIEAAQVAAAEAAAQAAATAAAEQAAATAATNAATNQSILSAIGAGGGTPASAALGGVEAGLGGASSAYTGATSAMAGTPAYGMPAGLEQVANPAFTELPAAELAQYTNAAQNAGQLAQNAQTLGQVADTSNAATQELIQNAPQGIDQVAQGAERFANTTSANFPVEGPAAPELSAMNNPPPATWPAGSPPSPPSTLESAFNKAIDWVKDNKMTTAMGAMQLLKSKGKGGGDEKKEYDGILSKYKMSPDFQGRQAEPSEYQYTPKVYNMAVGGITQASPNNQIPFPNTQYPGAYIPQHMYGSTAAQPANQNIVDGNQMPLFAGGGIASYRDGGKAAMDYYERMTKPKEGFSGKSDPGSRYAGEVMFDTDPDTRSLDPVTAAQIRMAKVNKRANMQLPGMKRPTPMGQLNMVPVTMKKNENESPNTVEAAQGGIMGLGGYAAGGNPRLLKGPGDGMSDNIPATIAGKQPARLADGEFVIPADVVSHLGNGSTEAGAKKLHQMMTQVRKARTGNPKQGKQINPNKYMPK